MPYFAPPGGSFTAKVAQQLQNDSLHGLGIAVPSVNVLSPRAVIPAGLAARRLRHQQQYSSVMTGMGLVTTPAKYTARYPTPAPVMFSAARTAAARAAAAQQISALSGLGAAAVRAKPMVISVVGGAGMPATAGVRRQAAMFMSPGGGYSQIPGFMPAIGPPLRRMSFLRGLGQDDQQTTMIPASDQLTAPSDNNPPLFLLPQPSDANASPSTYAAPTVLTPPPQVPTSVNNPPLVTGAPGQVFQPQPGVTVSFGVAPKPFMQQAPLGVPNSYLAVGAAAILALVALGGGKRRR